MTRPGVEAFFLPRDQHSLFCLLFNPPPGRPRAGAILHVPAFAEEMNKSRRAVTNAARALAANGWQVMVFDLHGTGDSDGELECASWSGWLADARAAFTFLRESAMVEPVLWGLRVGCLLINDLLACVKASELLFWQPSLSGDAALTQFLRLRTVGAVGSAKRQKDSIRSLCADLESGLPVEVAGYILPPAIALPMRQAHLGGPQYAARHVTWFETSPTEAPTCTPATVARIGEIEAAGANVSYRAVSGAAFWMTQEVDEAQSLVSVTSEVYANAR